MIARNSLLVLLNTLVGAILGFVALKFIALYMGVRTVGQLDFALGLVAIMSVVTDLGFNQAHVKRVSEGMEVEEALSFYIWFKLLTTLGFIALGIGLVAYAIFIQRQVLEDSTAATLAFLLAFQTLKGVQTVGVQTFDGRREIAKTQLSLLAENITRVGLSLAFALLYGGSVLGVGPFKGVTLPATLSNWLRSDPSATLAVAAVFGALVSVAFVISFLVRYKIQFRRPTKETWASYWRFARPIFFLYVVTLVAAQLDKVIVGFFGRDVDVGLLGGATRIAQLVTMASGALGVVLFPFISDLHARKDEKGLRKAVHLAVRYNSMVLFPVSLFIVLFSGPILQIILAGSFSPAQRMLSILAASALVHGIVIPIGTILVAMDHPEVASRIGVVISASNIVAMLILVPAQTPLYSGFGLKGEGAAIALLFSNLLSLGLVLFYLQRLWTLNILREMPMHLLAALASNTVGFSLFGYYFSYSPSIGTPLLLGLALLVIGLYLGLLYLLREFRKEDMSFFTDLISPSKLTDHVRRDLRR